jgi:RNA recognition motif-containing protein
VSVRLFVGNLPYGASEADLREYFGAVGQPTQIIMPVDRETGRPRGFAFVEYAERPMAEEAIKRFDAQPFKGRPLAVSEARPREERAPGARPPGGPPSGPRPPRSFDSSGPPSGGRSSGPPRRESSGPVRRGAKGKKGLWAEEKPKRPIQVRTTGRIYAVDDDDSGEDVEIDNFATSVAHGDTESDTTESDTTESNTTESDAAENHVADESTDE